jgi:hypothetical protein
MVLLLIGILMTTPPAQDLSRLLPAEVDGWKPKGKDQYFDHDNLFSLINGGAEVYRALNVKKVIDRRYQNPQGPDIIVDVFDMGSDRDAFGAFHIDIREEEDVGVGHESEFQGGSLYFWKDRYFVSVVALKQTEESKQAVIAFGKAIAKKIPRKGKKPELVKHLPKKRIVKSQVHYFHDWEGLNRLHFISDENLLGLSKETEGLLARLRPAGALVLIRYSQKKDAELARKRFAEAHKDDEDKFSAARASGSLLTVVLSVGAKGEAQKILEGVKP